MRKNKVNLSTGLTCKTDKNGRIHVYKTPENKYKNVSDYYLFFIVITFIITISILTLKN